MTEANKQLGDEHRYIADRYIDHAVLFWEAEQTNSTRLHQRRQLLVGVAIPLIGLLVAIVPRIIIPTDKLSNPVVSAFWFLLYAVLIAFCILKRGRIVIFSAAVLVLFDLIVVVSAIVYPHESSYLFASSIGILIAVSMWTFMSLLAAIYSLLIPASNSRDRPPITASSSKLLMSERRLGILREDMDGHSIAVFVRAYRSACDLLVQNTKLQVRLRDAQIWLVIACILLPWLVILSVQAKLAVQHVRTIAEDSIVEPQSSEKGARDG